MGINIMLFIKVFIITVFITFIIYKRSFIKNKLRLLAVLFSCDRSLMLNMTILSFFNHINNYERNITINFYFLDSGTPSRNDFVKEYKIKNVFYMNPNHYSYSYRVFWSYLHTEFVLFIEDDRPFIKDIERKIFFPNYIEEAMLVLRAMNDVKGILLKKDPYGGVKKVNIKTEIGNHTVCILVSPPWNYYYTNGPTVYKVKDLLNTGYYSNEYDVGKVFKYNKWYTGFTFRGIMCNSSILFTSECQGVANHIGSNSTQKPNRNICTVSLY